MGNVICSDATGNGSFSVSGDMGDGIYSDNIADSLEPSNAGDGICSDNVDGVSFSPAIAGDGICSNTMAAQEAQAVLIGCMGSSTGSGSSSYTSDLVSPSSTGGARKTAPAVTAV